MAGLTAIVGAAALGIAMYGADKILHKQSPPSPKHLQQRGNGQGGEEEDYLVGSALLEVPLYSTRDHERAHLRGIYPRSGAGGKQLAARMKKRGASSADAPSLLERDPEYFSAPPDPSSTGGFDTSAPQFADQEWQWDCSEGHCDPSARGNAGLNRPPAGDEYRGLPVEELGDFVAGVTDSRRYADVELNEPPHPTRTYADYGLGWGENLTSDEIPHGAAFATDLQFWGPRDYEAERQHRLPDYIHRFGEVDGREVNRPLDTVMSDFDVYAGESEAGWGTGAHAARSDYVRLAASNIYGSNVTTKSPYDDKRFLPPTQNRGGFSVHSGEPGLTFGSRLERAFNAFKGLRGVTFGLLAPPERSDVQLPAKRNHQVYESRVGNPTAPRSAADSYSGECINTVQGGRVNARLEVTPRVEIDRAPPGGETFADESVNPVYGGRHRNVGTKFELGAVPGVWDTQSGPAPAFGLFGGISNHDPSEGYHYTTRLRIAPDDEMACGSGTTKGSTAAAKGLVGFGIRLPQSDGASTRGGYIAPRAGGSDKSQMARVGFQVSHKQRDDFVPIPGCAAGMSSMPAPKGVWHIYGNQALGARNTTWSMEPPESIGDAANSFLQKALIDGRTEEALDDLYRVEHS